MSGGEDAAKRLAEAIQRGWKMLNVTCPNCGAPLFEVGGEAICAVCGSRFLLARSEEQAKSLSARYALSDLRESLIKVLDSQRERLELASDEGEVGEALEIIRRVVSILREIEEILRSPPAG